jgi:hypothetical protein
MHIPAAESTHNHAGKFVERGKMLPPNGKVPQ